MTNRTVRAMSPNAQEMEEIFYLAGVTPRSLAAAQVDHGQVDQLIQTAIEELLPDFDAIVLAMDKRSKARESVDVLSRLMRTGLATQDDAAALATAITQEASAQAALHQELDEVLASFADALPTQKGQALAISAANRAREVPPQYLVVSRSPSDWVALRSALANVRISEALGIDPESTSVQIVAEADADFAVAAAEVGLDDLPLVQQAWEQAIAQ